MLQTAVTALLQMQEVGLFAPKGDISFDFLNLCIRYAHVENRGQLYVRFFSFSRQVFHWNLGLTS